MSKPEKISEKGIKLLEAKGMEDKRLKPYDDQTSKTINEWCKGATIGIGHLIRKSEWGMFKDGISDDEVYELLNTDIKIAEGPVNKKVTAKINQNQFDALCIFVFNIGGPRFGRSSVLKIINDPQVKTPYSDLESAWKAWNKSQGKVMNGLKNRRSREWELYNS